MHIKTTCPRCESTYQVDPSLRGKRMRCPNLACRWIFEVHEDGVAPPLPPAPPTPPPAPPAASQRTGSVGDMVPILEAEPAPPPQPVPPTPSPPHVESIVSVLPAQPAPPDKPPPSAMSASALQPPPVRTRGVTPPPPAPVEPPPAPVSRKAPAPPPKKRPHAVAPPPSPPVEPPPVRVEQVQPPEKPEPSREAVPSALPEDGAPLDADALDLLRELGLGDEALSTSGPPDSEAPATAGEPDAFNLASVEPPPVRRGLDLSEGFAASPPDTSSATVEEPEAPPRGKRLRALVLMLVLLVLVGGGIWAVLDVSDNRSVGDESERAQKALKAYEDRDFAEAAQQFRELSLDFPLSPSLAKYRFLAELSDVRDPINRVQQDEKEAETNANRLIQLVAEYRDDPLLEKYRTDLHGDFKRLAEEFRELAKQKLDRKLLRFARELYKRSYEQPRPRPVPADITAALHQIEQNIAASDLRKNLLAYLDRALQAPSSATVQEARARVATANLSADAEVKERLDRLPEAHRASIRYTPTLDMQEQAPPAEDRAPSSLVTPPLEAHRGEVRSGLRPVLAQARGLLYALEPDNGQVRWAVRVSPTATTLPLSLPATALAPEQLLVLSADSLTLSALDARTGVTRWSRTLLSPCLSQPVVVGDRAFVPTYDGRVEEIEVNAGARRGYYDLGQPLTTGGAHQVGTNLVYFAADSFCVYALDVAKHTCSAVLYTGHPSGGLLSRPTILKSGYLLLAQADGLDKTKLRAFALPPTSADADPVQEVSLPGWAWFPPQSDANNLALVTDAGTFTVYGIEPRGERAPPLFPRFETKLVPSALGAPGQARAQLAYSAGGRFWVLAHGDLHLLQTAFTRDKGPHLDPPSQTVLQVGSPLHATQVRQEDGLVLYLVTQVGDGQACLVTALDGQGAKRWQRQLGMICRNQPIAVDKQVLAQDLAGRLFLFDADRVAPQTDRAWYFAGRLVRGRGMGGGLAFQFLRGGENVYAVAVAQGTSGPTLRVRVFPGGKEADASGTVLPAPLAGTPAVVGNGLILPLANGYLLHQPLAGGKGETGPNWRAAQVDAGAVAYVVPLGADEFLVTDGSHGIKRMFCDGKVWEQRATGTPGNRIIAPPVLVPPASEGGATRICVADSGRFVTLLNGEELKTVQRRWRLSGSITAGPFVRGRGIVCVVDKRKVVWLDPAKEEPKEDPLWYADFRTDVVGAPQLIDGVLVVADQDGQIHALDPATGKPGGPGYALAASAAPTAAPLPFGADRLFVPLTDGTVLLPSRRGLHHPLRGFPLFR